MIENKRSANAYRWIIESGVSRDYRAVEDKHFENRSTPRFYRQSLEELQQDFSVQL